ncbi:hypothetical protein [Caldivirga maquilingensis]|uniref:hypothetical protein n=1 Tax=Caldivirga maquilingensis TaxID=76887 RepID=UPI00064F891E|nr:hypothetical protein [Caldivirga maquilingensis]
MKHRLSKPGDVRKYLNHVLSVSSLIILAPLLLFIVFPFFKRLMAIMYTSTLLLFILGFYLIGASMIMKASGKGRVNKRSRKLFKD